VKDSKIKYFNENFTYQYSKLQEWENPRTFLILAKLFTSQVQEIALWAGKLLPVIFKKKPPKLQIQT
jgi:hypothetical protein